MSALQLTSLDHDAVQQALAHAPSCHAAEQPCVRASPLRRQGSSRTIVEAAQAELAADDEQALPQREALQHQPEAHHERRVEHQAQRDECDPVRPARAIITLR